MAKSGVPSVHLKKLLSVEQLPAMPQSAVRILDISKDPTAGPMEYATPIEGDPGLTVQVLRFVNSSFFGFRNEITNVKQAITLVGVRTIKNFALWNAVFSLIPNPNCGLFNLECLWQDSLRRGLFARLVGHILRGERSEEAFAAALLQDMAVPLLAKEIPDAYNKLFQARLAGERPIRLSALEEHVFGWNHAEAAALMAHHWDLPDQFTELLENHLAIDEYVSQSSSYPEHVAVAMSALLPATNDPNWSECALFEDYYSRIRQDDNPSVTELLQQVDEEFAEFAPVLRMSKPVVSLQESYVHMTEAVSE